MLRRPHWGLRTGHVFFWRPPPLRSRLGKPGIKFGLRKDPGTPHLPAHFSPPRKGMHSLSRDAQVFCRLIGVPELDVHPLPFVDTCQYSCSGGLLSTAKI